MPRPPFWVFSLARSFFVWVFFFFFLFFLLELYWLHSTLLFFWFFQFDRLSSFLDEFAFLLDILLSFLMHFYSFFFFFKLYWTHFFYEMYLTFSFPHLPQFDWIMLLKNLNFSLIPLNWNESFKNSRVSCDFLMNQYSLTTWWKFLHSLLSLFFGWNLF